MHRDLARERDEVVVAGDEVGVAVDLDEHADLAVAVDVGLHGALGGLAAAHLEGLVAEPDAQQLDGLLDVAARSRRARFLQSIMPAPVRSRSSLTSLRRSGCAHFSSFSWSRSSWSFSAAALARPSLAARWASSAGLAASSAARLRRRRFARLLGLRPPRRRRPRAPRPRGARRRRRASAAAAASAGGASAGAASARRRPRAAALGSAARRPRLGRRPPARPARLRPPAASAAAARARAAASRPPAAASARGCGLRGRRRPRRLGACGPAPSRRRGAAGAPRRRRARRRPARRRRPRPARAALGLRAPEVLDGLGDGRLGGVARLALAALRERLGARRPPRPPCAPAPRPRGAPAPRPRGAPAPRPPGARAPPPRGSVRLPAAITSPIACVIDVAGADRVVVARDDVVDAVRVAVRVDEADDRDAQALGLAHGDRLGLEVDHEHRVGHALHVLDAAEVGAQLLEVGLGGHALARRQQPELALGLVALEVVQALDPRARSSGSWSAGRRASGG